jgi:hypothetical protein
VVCNSEHGSDEYAKGWFIAHTVDGGRQVIAVVGEMAVMNYARTKKLQIFWNSVSLESALAQLGLILPPGGI